MNYKHIDGAMYMSLNLGSRSHFIGDWTDPQIRKRIFKKPRKYVIDMCLMTEEGSKALSEYKLNVKCSQWELSQEIFRALKDIQQDYPDMPVDYTQSYAIIKLNQEN